MENVRYNISPCAIGEVTEFIKRIDTKLFIPNGAVKATDNSHYDRYSFLRDDSRVAVVYDTYAGIVSITGRQDYAQSLLDLFGTQTKAVKRSTVPAQGSVPSKPQVLTKDIGASGGEAQSRAKLFVSPDRIRRRNDYKPVPTVIATSKGAIISTDEIYPPQVITRKQPRNDDNAVATEKNFDAQSDKKVRIGFSEDGDAQPERGGFSVKKRPLTSYGEKSDNRYSATPLPQLKTVVKPMQRTLTEQSTDSERAGLAISVGTRERTQPMRRAVISFGTDDYGNDSVGEFKINTRVQTAATYGNGQPSAEQPQKRKRGRPPKADKQQSPPQQTTASYGNGQPNAEQPQKRKRGRPPKIEKAQNNYVAQDTPTEKTSFEYKNGYSVKNYPQAALDGAIKRLREYGKTVSVDGVEFGGTPQEIRSYTVTDSAGQKVLLRYAIKRMTLQLQGKRSNLFGEVMSQVSYDSDYSSALENYVENVGNGGGAGAGKKVSDVQNKLKKRLPTAFEFLSEQSRIDFSYGIHDFGQTDLHLSDYSVLLVPAFRGLERFIFDLQRVQGINVKMIGQAYDKDDEGKYILKSGYSKRINSIIYCEVMVALYTEYFSQRNFFAHSDNTDNNVSRSIPERVKALRIFDHLLDVVEYNSKKLKEIGFSTGRAK